MLADRFIGQTAAVQQLQTAIDASLARGIVLPHALLLAPPGVGKTKLARDISIEVGAPYAALEMPATDKELINILYGYSGVLLLDEVHQATRKTLDMLLPFLVDGTFRYGSITEKNPRITVVAATTDPQDIPDAFRSRFRLQPTFTDYTNDEIAEIIRRRALSDYDILIPDDTSVALADASLGNPRQAVALMETFMDLSAVSGTPASAEEVLSHLGITRQGLRPDHLQYLQVLKKQGGTASLQTIAQLLFMPTASMRWVEKDLLRLGVIGISSVGRELKSMAWEADEGAVTSAETASCGPNVNPYTLEPRT